ncbi:MAG: hypothetical protein V3V99_08620 [candidate division Zixibacteria bacterium]
MEKVLKEMLEELKNIKAILAITATEKYETKNDKIIHLAKFGLNPAEISELIGTTPGTVSVQLSKAKKKGKKKSK